MHGVIDGTPVKEAHAYMHGSIAIINEAGPLAYRSSRVRCTPPEQYGRKEGEERVRRKGSNKLTVIDNLCFSFFFFSPFEPSHSEVRRAAAGTESLTFHDLTGAYS